MTVPFVLYGASELGRDAMSVVAPLSAAGARGTCLGFIDDDLAKAGKEYFGLPVLGGRAWLEGRQGAVEIVTTIGEPRVRRLLAEALGPAGFTFTTLLHPSIQASPWVTFGAGTLVMAGCTFTVNVEVGRHAVLNPGCTVAHDVRIGDFCYVSPGVDLAGGVVVEEGAYLGVGAVVLPQRRIGAGALVGAGAVVTKDVPPNEVWAGVPARRLRDVVSPWSANDRSS